MLALVILSILFTWLAIAAVCIGIGGLLLRCFHFSFSPVDALWTGIALICAILQLYHFFRPVDLAVVFLLLVLALAGWFWNRDVLFQRLAVAVSQPLNVLLLFLAGAMIAFRAAGPCEHYDTGLYGATAIRWFSTYPLVPGLGNLIGQLGFNSSVFLWVAVLDQGPWHGLSHHLFVPFLIAAFFASILPAVVRVLRSMQVSASDWFQTLLLIPAAIWAAAGKIVGANTDLPASVVCLLAASMAFRGLEEKTPEEDKTRRMNLVAAMLLFSLAPTFKISSMVFASTGWTLALVKLWSLSRTTPQRKWLATGAVLLSAAIVLPWMGRGLMLTGYPLYPSTVLSIPVDWKESGTDAQWQGDFARSFARVPELTMAYAHGWHWLRPWFRSMVMEREGFVIPLAFAFAGALAGLFTRWRRRSEEPVPEWLWLLLPGLTGMLFWFLEAPAVRFGELALWTTAATLGTLPAIRVLDTSGRRHVALAALLLITGWAAHPRLLWGSNFRPSIGVRSFLRLPEARVLPHRTLSGMVLYVPVETNQCWDAPLPCAPEFNRLVLLRQPGNLKGGFRPAEVKSDTSTPKPLF